MSEALNQAIDQGNYYKALVILLLIAVAALSSAVIYVYKQGQKKTVDADTAPVVPKATVQDSKGFGEIKVSLDLLVEKIETHHKILSEVSEVLEILREGLIRGPRALDELTEGVADLASGLRSYKQTTSERLNTALKHLTELVGRNNESKP